MSQGLRTYGGNLTMENKEKLEGNKGRTHDGTNHSPPPPPAIYFQQAPTCLKVLTILNVKVPRER